jgi:hypothetical protein
LSGHQIAKSALVRDSAVAQQLCENAQRLVSQILIDEGSCRVKASAALQEGWLSSFALGTAISGKTYATVGRRHFFL